MTRSFAPADFENSPGHTQISSCILVPHVWHSPLAVDFLVLDFFLTGNQKVQNVEQPLFGELSRSSRDSFELETDSQESRDDRLNSPENGYSIFLDFLVLDFFGTETKKSKNVE